MRLQSQMKHLYDKRGTERKFEIDDMVLMWKYGKFDPIWLGPYSIYDNFFEESYLLRDLTRGILELLVHGQFLKSYFS